MKSFLEGSPVEILDLILRNVKADDSRKFGRLRMVCRTVNDVAEPLALNQLVISFSGSKIASMEEMLNAMVSKESPFVRQATLLWIHDLLPSCTNPDTHMGNLLRLQSELLIPALRSLAKLHSARYDADYLEPYGPILQTLSSLPALRKFELSFNGSTLLPLNFGAFSHLVDIQFSWLPLESLAIHNAANAIANGLNALTSLLLKVDGEQHAEPFQLVNFFQEPLAPPAKSIPSLKELRLFSGRYLVLSPASIPFLRSLTRLELSRGFRHMGEASFWTALTESKIRLRALRIPKLEFPIVEYLASFSGLEEFVFDHMNVGVHGDNPTASGITPAEEVQLFYDSVLPSHCSTLRTLGLACDVSERALWYSSLERLEQIALCPSLRHLEVMYHHVNSEDPFMRFAPPRHIVSDPQSQPNFPLHQLLSVVATKCSELHELKLLMDCRVHLHGAPPLRRHYRHSGWKLRNGPADLACLRAVCATQFPMAVDGISASVAGNTPVPEPHFRVRTAWKVFLPRRLRSSGLEQVYTLDVEGEDPDDHEGGSRACSRCGDLWTSYAMCGAQPWASLGTAIVQM